MEPAQVRSRREKRARVIPPQPVRAALVILAFVGVLYLVEILDRYFILAELEAAGIDPRELDGLDGVLWSPFLHDQWGHLFANTAPVLVLGWLSMAGGIRQFFAVTAVIWLVSGLGTWLVGAEGVHIGASGLAFGWMMFLLVRGFFNRSFPQILVAIVLFAYWGGMLWGLLPGQPGISWEAHFFGALGGFLAASLVARVDRGGRTGRSRLIRAGRTGTRRDEASGRIEA